MNLNEILSLLNDEKISKDKIFELVDQVRNLDFKDDKNLRSVVRSVSEIANRNLTQEMEDFLVEKIKKDGIPNDIFNLFS